MDCSFNQSGQDSLTEMVTTKGGEGDICTSYRKVFRGRVLSAKILMWEHLVYEEKPGGPGRLEQNE